MIFDELKINTIVHENELYVRVSDLTQHLSNAVNEFADETDALSKIIKLTELERTFIIGLVNGMYNVVLMLTQSHDEHELKQINTIDELLEKFNEHNK